jgi:preprotein translocase subunit YajC
MLFALIGSLLVLADGEGTSGGAPGGGLLQFAPLVLIVIAAYFLLLLPMRRQEKQRQALIAALKKNDRIVNSGGIIGVVESIKEKEDEVILKGGIRITRSSISRILTPDEPAKEQK